MIRVSGLLIEDMRTAVCIRFCVAAKERGAGGSAGKREGEREGEEEEKEQGERSVLPEGTKRQRVARRQDASGNGPGCGRRRQEAEERGMGKGWGRGGK